jgi:hypothetical protein
VIWDIAAQYRASERQPLAGFGDVLLQTHDTRTRLVRSWSRRRMRASPYHTAPHTCMQVGKQQSHTAPVGHLLSPSSNFQTSIIFTNPQPNLSADPLSFSPQSDLRSDCDVIGIAHPVASDRRDAVRPQNAHAQSSGPGSDLNNGEENASEKLASSIQKPQNWLWPRLSLFDHNCA